MKRKDNFIISFRYNEYKMLYYTRIGKKDVAFVVDGVKIVMIENDSNHYFCRKNYNFNYNFNSAFNYKWTMEQLVNIAFVSMKDILPEPNDCSDKYKEFYNALEYDHFYLSDEYKSNDKPIDIYNKILSQYDILQNTFQYKLTSEYNCKKCNDQYYINFVKLSHAYYTPIYSFKMVKKNEYKKAEGEYVIFNSNSISFNVYFQNFLNHIYNYYIISRKRESKTLSDLCEWRDDCSCKDYIEIDGVLIRISYYLLEKDWFNQRQRISSNKHLNYSSILSNSI